MPDLTPLFWLAGGFIALAFILGVILGSLI